MRVRDRCVHPEDDVIGEHLHCDFLSALQSLKLAGLESGMKQLIPAQINSRITGNG
jgi:hypothetical protein